MVYCDILSVVANGLTMRFDDFRNSSLRHFVGSHYDKLSVEQGRATMLDPVEANCSLLRQVVGYEKWLITTFCRLSQMA